MVLKNAKFWPLKIDFEKHALIKILAIFFSLKYAVPKSCAKKELQHSYLHLLR